MHPLGTLTVMLSLTEFSIGLLYQEFSVLQIHSSINVPVLDLPPDHRISFDWGFQINHNLPFELSSFYNIPIWPGLFGNVRRRRRRSPSDLPQRNEKNEMKFPLHPYINETSFYTPIYSLKRHSSDFTAGELYMGLEQLLVSYGYHETCLLRSVCELAQHPFSDGHILADIVTLFLTPSLHRGFDITEHFYRDRYEQAELSGFLGENCSNLYVDCDVDFLGLISKINLNSKYS